MISDRNHPEALLQRINIFICTVDQDGFFVYLNSYWEEKLGWSLQELKAMPWSHFVHPDDVAATNDQAQSIFEQGSEVTNFTNRYRTKDNQWRYLEWAARIAEDKSCVIATATDATDKKFYLKEKQKTDQLLRAAAAMANMGYWSLDIDKKAWYWSDEMYQIHGVDKSSCVPTTDTVVDLCHPDDMARAREYIEQGMANGEGWFFHFRIVRPSGEIRRVISKADVRFSPMGKPIEIFGIFQDVTQIDMVSRERDLMSRVADYLTTGIVIADNKKNVIWVNHSFTEMTGYSLEELAGKPLGSLLQGEDTCQDTVGEISKRLRDCEPVNVEILNYHKNGSKYWNHLSIMPVQEDGGVTYFIGVQQDVTQMKEQQEILGRVKRMETVKELAAGIAHDFNNILAIVDGNRELLEMKCQDRALLPYLNNMGKAIQKAKMTTERLLKSSHHNASPKSLVLVDNIIQELQVLFDEIIPSNKTLYWDLNAGCSVKISPGDLSDAITNIVVNAINAIQHHGEIRISTRVVTSGFNPGPKSFVYLSPVAAQSYCLITIADTGIGIPSEELESVFLPFVSKNRFSSGSGLGLSMVAAFVSREGAGLTVESREGEGSVFALWLPVSELEYENDVEEDRYAVSRTSELRLVLIDDEEALLDATAELLRSKGHKVAAFADPVIAIQWIEDNQDQIDLIVSDETMPGEIQGHDIFDHYNDAIGVVIISGYGKDLYGCFPRHHLVKKPFSIQQLTDTMQEIYKQRKALT